MKKKHDYGICMYPALKKLLMKLKIAFIIVLVSVTNILAKSSYSQAIRISLDMENKSLGQVMDDIEKQCELYFIFNQKQIDINRLVNIKAENKIIADILSQLFNGTNVNYAIFDRKILLTTDPIENDLLYISSSSEYQQKKIIGTVSDANTGEPLSGVNILVKGTLQGVISDANGKFSIVVDSESAILTFSYVGYVSEEIPVSGQSQINVKLGLDIKALEEVVVVGYGTQKKGTL